MDAGQTARAKMLTALRSLAGTWVAKILFLLLIASFAIWGIGDIARNFGRDTAVARVDGQGIELAEAQAATRRELQRLTRQLGGQFEADARIRRAVAQQVVEQLVQDRVLRAEADRLGLAVPDGAVREFVFGLQGFHGTDGQFSRPVFEQFLRTNDVTEPGFLALVRADLARLQVAQAVRAGATAPAALARPLLRWQEEQRGVTIVSLPVSAAPEPPAPEEAQLRRFHENNPERFSSPEYRQAAVAVLTAALVTQEVAITDADLAAAYEQRRAQFETPEYRTLSQVLVAEEAPAQAIAAEWRAGADAAAIATAARAAGGELIELGRLDRAGLPVPELAEAAFAAPEGGVVGPVRSPFGWHVLRVAGIEPGSARTLAEVHDELRATIAAEKAADMAFERANRVEDALAGGATLKEAAERFGLAYTEVTTDAAGLGPDGQPVTLPVIEAAREAVLKVVFGADRGGAARLMETEAGFVATEVREISPPALRPFETVAPAVREAFLADARRRSQEVRAAGLLGATQGGGKTLAAAAAEAGLGSREVGALTRGQRQDLPIPAQLLPQVFGLPLHGTTMAATADGFAVAQVTEITAPDPDADPAGVARLRGELTQAVADDIETALLAALRARADVRINPRLVDSLVQP